MTPAGSRTVAPEGATPAAMGRAAVAADRPRSRHVLLDDAALLAVALVVRVLHALAIRGEPMFRLPLVDGGLYWQDALKIVAGQPLDPVFYRPPLLSFVLGCLARLFGPDASSARFALAALSALAAPITARLARPIVGRGGALLAGAFVALYAPAIFYGAELLPASIVLVLNLLLLLALGRAERGAHGLAPARAERPHGKPAGATWAAVAGLLVGLSALAWPAILALVPVLLFNLRRAWTGALALLAGVAIAVLPCTLHNARGGDLVLISSNGGVNFYMGNHAGADGWSARSAELPNEPGEARAAAERIAEAAEGRRLRPSQVSAYWSRRAWAWMAHDPAGAARLYGRKLYALVNDRDISDNIDLASVAEISPPLRASPIGFGVLLALALLGIPALWRMREGRLLLAYGVAVAIPVLAFFVVGRFRLPLLPVLATAAAAGTFALVSSLRREGLGAAPIFLVVLAGFAFSHSTFFGIAEDRSWHFHYLRGDALYRTGDLEGATRAFEESLRRNGRVALTMNSLGFVYAERGMELARADSLIRRAIALEPVRSRYYLESLGRVLYREGRLDEAAATLERAIGLLTAGADTSAWLEAMGHLADVRLAQGRGREADSLRAEAQRAREHWGPR